VSGGFTLCVSERVVATKQHWRDEKGVIYTSEYSGGLLWWFKESPPVTDFDSMAGVLEVLLDAPNAFIIRGEPKAGIRGSDVQWRRLLNGPDATVDDVPRQWLHLDIDHVADAEIDVVARPNDAVKYVLDRLYRFAPELKDVSAFCQFSSSAGVYDTTHAKSHVWIWLDRPYANSELKRWSKQVNGRADFKLIDDTLFNAIQPNYVARPIFAGGLADPFEGRRRFVIMRGADFATLVIAAEMQAVRSARSGKRKDPSFRGGGFERHLADIGGVSGLREPARSAIAAFVGLVGVERALEERGPVLLRIEAALRAAPRGPRSEATVEEYVRDLPEMLDWTVKQQREREAAAPVDEPADTAPALPIDEARQQGAILVHDTIAALTSTAWHSDEGTPPPAALIVMSIGVGKSQIALDEALRRIQAGGGPIVLAAPTHRLNGQLLERAKTLAEELGIDARIETWLGREAIDPSGDGKAKMCLDLKSVREVIEAGLKPQTNACQRKLADGTVRRCRYYDECPYQKQRARRADLWLVSHAALGHAKPAEIPAPALLIIDENPVTALLRGLDGNEIVRVSDLEPAVEVGSTLVDLSVLGGKWANGPAWLRSSRIVDTTPPALLVRTKMTELHKLNGLGPVRRAAFAETGLMAGELSSAVRQVLGLIVKPPLLPGMGGAERRALLKKAAGNRALLCEATMYRLLRDFLQAESLGPKSGHISLVKKKESKGSAYEAWRLTWIAPVATGWRAPTLILDATAREDYRFALRAALPGLRDDLGGEIRATTPHLEIKAVISRDFSLKAIKADRKRAREIAAVARRELLALGGGCGLVVANKLLADAIREAGPPHGIEVAHFNAVRGLDTWGHARLQITVGRTLPPPAVVELIAGAITGSAIEPHVGWYLMRDRKLVVGGKVVASQRVAWHPDKRAEAVRWQTCEGEILQSERLRAVARTATTPATWMLAGCPIPAGLKLVAVEDYEPPSPVDLMLAARGVALLSPAHAAKAYPGIFRNEKAAKYALAGAGIPAAETELGPDSLIGVSIRRNGPSSCRYQLAGRGRHIAAALVDTAAVPDPRSWLEARLGPLAAFWGGSDA
jgi:hypothetical protein